MKTTHLFILALALPLPLAGAKAQNLILNGDFEAGNTGFSNDYVHSPGDMRAAGTYCVVTDPSWVHSAWDSFGDHTTGGGLMLVANGDVDPTNVVWRQTVSLPTRGTFVFSGWAASSHPANPGSFYLYANGIQVGQPVNLPDTTGRWQNYSALWSSGASNSVLLEVRVLTTALYGNDFVLDDLSLRRVAQTAVPSLSIEPAEAAAAMVLKWPSVTNQLYQLQWTSALESGRWFSTGPLVTGTGAGLSVTNSVDGSPQRFYRVLLVD